MANEYPFPAPEAVVLPNLFASPGEALAQAAALKERRYERDAELKQQQQQKYGLANLKNLNDTTDKINLPLGNDYANTLMNSEAKKVYDKLISQVNSTDPVTFDYMLHREADNLFNWEKKFRTDLDFTQKFTEDVLKSNPNLDPNQTKQLAQSQLEGKYFIQNPNGEYERNHPDQVSNDQSFLHILQDPKMQGILAVGGQEVLKNFIQNQKLQPAKDSDYVSNKGFVDASQYDAKYNPALKKLVIDENGNPTIQMRTEDFSLGNGVNLKMIPKETYDEYMSNPAVASAINKMWNPKAFAIEQQAAQKGIDVLDPHSEEMLKRDFIRQQIEENGLDLSYVAKKEKQVIPKPPVISNTFNLGDGSNLNNIYKNIQDIVSANARNNNATRYNQLDDQGQAMVKQAVENAGVKAEKLDNVILAIDPNDGKTKVYKAKFEKRANGLTYPILDPTTELVTITPIGVNLPKQADVKGKRLVVEQGNNNQAPKSSKKTVPWVH